MIDTSPCEHCHSPVEFEVSEWHHGLTRECANCGQPTVVHFKPGVSKPRVPRPLPSAPPAPPRKIEETLESIGISCLVLAGAATVLLAFATLPDLLEGRTERMILKFGIGLGLVLQGFIVKSCFYGFAEVIKLLRKRA